MSNLKDNLIADFYDFNVYADITIESLVNLVMDNINQMSGQDFVKLFGKCPMCEDCPDNCNLTNENGGN